MTFVGRGRHLEQRKHLAIEALPLARIHSRGTQGRSLRYSDVSRVLPPSDATTERQNKPFRNPLQIKEIVALPPPEVSFVP